jgi:hypothetical protein
MRTIREHYELVFKRSKYGALALTDGHADAAESIRWRWKHRLSLTAAAEAVGMSRRQIAYYVSGEHEVPRTVLLACKGWETERQAVA